MKKYLLSINTGKYLHINNRRVCVYFAFFFMFYVENLLQHIQKQKKNSFFFCVCSQLYRYNILTFLQQAVYDD